MTNVRCLEVEKYWAVYNRFVLHLSITSFTFYYNSYQMCNPGNYYCHMTQKNIKYVLYIK